MSDLDAVFGPRATPVLGPAATRTAWPRAPEHLRPVLDKWEELVGFHPDAAVVQRFWIKGAEDWYNAFGGAQVELFERAFHRLMQVCEREVDGLKPSHPGALIKTALGEKIQPVRQVPQGMFGDE